MMQEFIVDTLHLNTELIKWVLAVISKKSDIFDYVCYLLIYFLPGIIVLARGGDNRGLILVCNLIFGFSGIGWLIIAIWACKETPSKRIAKECPYCNEFIKRSATACHHCRKPLNEEEDSE
jgi:hypothetical protein